MWIDIDTNKVVRSHSEIRESRPNTSLPAIITDDMIADLGFYPIVQVAVLYNRTTQGYEEIAPVKDKKGVWKQTYRIFDLDQETIDSNLKAARDRKNTEINQGRLQSNFNFFLFNGNRISCDTLSRSDIDAMNGYVTLYGGLPDDWPGGWKTMDNSYVPISNADQWKEFYRSMYNAGVANFKRAQALKTKLAALNDIDEIESISWQEYPPK